jgi:prevent-host-death family protein
VPVDAVGDSLVACTTYSYYTVSMRQVPVRELNQHTADVLARVEMGERVEVTRNGTRVAIIEPAQPNPLSVLIEAEELRPARGSLPLFSDSEVTTSDSTGLDAILEDRYGGDRW